MHEVVVRVVTDALIAGVLKKEWDEFLGAGTCVVDRPCAILVALLEVVLRISRAALALLVCSWSVPGAERDKDGLSVGISNEVHRNDVIGEDDVRDALCGRLARDAELADAEVSVLLLEGRL